MGSGHGDRTPPRSPRHVRYAWLPAASAFALAAAALALFCGGFMLARVELSTRSRGAHLRPQPPRLFDAVVVIVVDALRPDMVFLPAGGGNASAAGAHAAVMERTRALAAGEYSDLATGKLRTRMTERAGRGTHQHTDNRSLNLARLLHPTPPCPAPLHARHTPPHTHTCCAAALRFVADAPTATHQRLKALVTGGLPTFVDHEYDLLCNKDTHTNGHVQWFYFSTRRTRGAARGDDAEAKRPIRVRLGAAPA